MNTMRIEPNPSGLIPAEPTLQVDHPIDDLVAGEQIWSCDFIKNVNGVARRSTMDEATHAALQSASEGESVKCERFDARLVQS